jgi:hypothetical protein
MTRPLRRARWAQAGDGNTATDGGGREEQDRGVAAALQWEPSSHRPGVVDTPALAAAQQAAE